MRFIKPAARAPSTPVTIPIVRPTQQAVRWSDVVANRETTHPDAAHVPIKVIMNVTELLEQVLAHVPVRDLIRAQPTCKAFNKLIRTSPTLKKKLWRSSEEVAECKWALVPDEGQAEDVYRPHGKAVGGARAAALIEYRVSHGFSDLKADSQRDHMAVHAFNPALFKYKNLKSDFQGQFWYTLSPGTTPGGNQLALNNIDITKLHKNASCRNMQIGCPPVKSATLNIHGSVRYSDYIDRRGLPKWTIGELTWRHIHNPTGLTFGEVVDAANKAIAELRPPPNRGKKAWLEPDRGTEPYLHSVFFYHDFAVSEKEFWEVEEAGNAGIHE